MCSMTNIHEAHINARKGKRHYREVKMVDRNPDKYLSSLQAMLENGANSVSRHEKSDGETCDMIGYSKDYPEMFGSRNGQVVFRFNVEAIEVTTEEGVAETQYKFEQITIPPPVNKSIDGVKALLKSVAADKRWQKETGGVTWNGHTIHTIHTDRESQAKIIAAYVAARDGIRINPSKWKVSGGFIDVTNVEAIEMALTVMGHVQGCYDAETAMCDQIDACTTLDELIVLPIKI